MSTTVLLTEHEPATRTLLEQQLHGDGFELASAGDAPDLVLAGDDQVGQLGPLSFAVAALSRGQVRRGCLVMTRAGKLEMCKYLVITAPDERLDLDHNQELELRGDTARQPTPDLRRQLEDQRR